MAQCLIHRTGSLFKAFINVTGTPNSIATATLGSRVFTCILNESGVGTILVKKKGTYTVVSNASGAQTKTVSVTEFKQTYSVNISGKFTISISHTNSSVAVTRNSSPYAGAASGSLGNGAIIYYGDTFTVTGTANDGFSAWKKTVTGATASGNTYTVTGDVTVSTTADATVYKLLFNEGIGTVISAERIAVGTPGSYAGATNGKLVHNSIIYKGDVLKLTATASQDAYNTPTINLNSPENYTVTGDTTVSATTTVKKFTLTIKSNVNNALTVKRTSSPYQGASTIGTLSTLADIYYGDVITISQKVATYYSGYYKATNAGVNVYTKQTADGSITVSGAVYIESVATRNIKQIQISRYGSWSSTSTGGSILFYIFDVPEGYTWRQLANDKNHNTSVKTIYASNGNAGTNKNISNGWDTHVVVTAGYTKTIYIVKNDSNKELVSVDSTYSSRGYGQIKSKYDSTTQKYLYDITPDGKIVYQSNDIPIGDNVNISGGSTHSNYTFSDVGSISYIN